MFRRTRQRAVNPLFRLRKRRAAVALTTGAAALGAGLAAATGPMLFSPADAAPAASAAQQRVHAGQLTASEQLKAALIEEEGVRYTVYRDVAGNPTVGVGHLVTPRDGLSIGQTISEAQVLALLHADLQIAEFGVRQVLDDLPVHQHEFDALVDLVFNVGAGKLTSGESPRLTRAIAAGNYAAIAEELDYHHAAGAKAAGLVHRSERRANIFLAAAYDDPRQIGSSNA